MNARAEPTSAVYHIWLADGFERAVNFWAILLMVKENNIIALKMSRKLYDHLENADIIPVKRIGFFHGP